jgi:hypothetical protein
MEVDQKNSVVPVIRHGEIKRDDHNFLSKDESFVYLNCPMCSNRIFSNIQKTLSPKCHGCDITYETEVNGKKVNVLDLIKSIHVKILKSGKLRRYRDCSKSSQLRATKPTQWQRPQRNRSYQVENDRQCESDGNSKRSDFNENYRQERNKHSKPTTPLPRKSHPQSKF